MCTIRQSYILAFCALILPVVLAQSITAEDVFRSCSGATEAKGCLKDEANKFINKTRGVPLTTDNHCNLAKLVRGCFLQYCGSITAEMVYYMKKSVRDDQTKASETCPENFKMGTSSSGSGRPGISTLHSSKMPVITMILLSLLSCIPLYL